MELGDCMTYAVIVVAVTSLWVYIGRRWSFPFLANAMFFPTILSLFFVENYAEFYMQTVGVKGLYPSVLYSVVAVVFVYAVVWGCVGLNILLGWGAWVPAPPNATVHGHNSIEWQGFLRAAGEEIGWRCYLLPCLMSSLSPFYALLISGVTWGLFHVAVMIVLVNRLHPPRPYLTVTVQCLSVAICAFPTGWLSIKAGYSIWPSTVMHFVWNRVNPQILGSIYTHERGRITGEQWLINGEGLAGCLVMSIFSVAALLDLS